MKVISDALDAKKHRCPSCGVGANVACSDQAAGRQRLTLIETHVERLALVDDLYLREDPRVDAEG